MAPAVTTRRSNASLSFPFSSSLKWWRSEVPLLYTQPGVAFYQNVRYSEDAMMPADQGIFGHQKVEYLSY